MIVAKDTLEKMRTSTSRVLYLMDYKGKGNEGNNSTMLWNRQWEEVRQEVFWIHERLNAYISDD